MTENEFLFESIALKGQCPDCQSIKLQSNGPIVHCRSCQSMFIAQQFYVRRVTPSDIGAKTVLKSGEVIDFKMATR